MRCGLIAIISNDTTNIHQQTTNRTQERVIPGVVVESESSMYACPLVENE